MNQTEETAVESPSETEAASQDRLVFAAIAAFLYEENKDPASEPASSPPHPMSPWKLLGRRESVG